ncbi:MAG: hypothetical protein KJ072_28095 [Verrucomicrobia bacterium]|nr:hypothetical protein [Verrucomicrobiota bacterium]
MITEGAGPAAVTLRRANDLDTVVTVDYATTYQITEDAGSVRLRVDRGNDGDEPITVNYVTVDGTALAGVDYEAASGTG